MQNRYSAWQLNLPESHTIFEVEAFLEEQVLTGKNDPASEAVNYARREDVPQSGYDLAETVLRRRTLIIETGFGYKRIQYCMGLSKSLNISFEHARAFAIKGALTWFLEVAPVLCLRESLPYDIIFLIYSYVISHQINADAINTIHAAMIRKIGFFKELTPMSNQDLVQKYCVERVSKFTKRDDVEAIKIKL